MDDDLEMSDLDVEDVSDDRWNRLPLSSIVELELMVFLFSKSFCNSRTFPMRSILEYFIFFQPQFPIHHQ